MSNNGPAPTKIAGMTRRTIAVVLIVLVITAALPLVLSNYQLELATEMLIFGDPTPGGGSSPSGNFNVGPCAR